MPPVKKPERTRGRTFLKEWRVYRDLTQEEAAARVDIDRTTLGRIEKGALPYNQDFLEKAAEAYGCEPEDLIMIDPLRPDPPKLVYDALKHASPSRQQEVWRMIEALLKSGTNG